MVELAIVGGTLINGKGGAPLRDSVVTIDKGRFVAVGARKGSAAPEARKVIDASGKFVIPDYLNANVHLVDGVMLMGKGGVEYLARFEGRLHEVIEEAAQVALAGGITTVFGTWNPLEPVLYARDRIANGEVPGPRLFAAGNIVGMGGPFSADFMKQAREVTSKTFADRMDDLFAAGVGRRPVIHRFPRLQQCALQSPFL
jgi:imidazolonepropionase-like amidohydrolase